MKKIMTIVLAGFLGASVSLLSGCNTVKGIGQDVKKGGQEIERAAS
ncbi:entericidin A/B family lipoprotein [Legionella spiritensis]|nr:entericidin A/B family lipoprotein [Legionella spiritensis]VEG92449.1 entericidin A [Legionella spiritensis]